MRCETCRGKGQLLLDAAGRVIERLAEAVLILPCPNCGGCGFAHCCEGERPVEETRQWIYQPDST